MDDLANAIKDLIIEYNKACKQDTIDFPLGHALYQTWKKYDNEYKFIEQFKDTK